MTTRKGKEKLLPSSLPPNNYGLSVEQRKALILAYSQVQKDRVRAMEQETATRLQLSPSPPPSTELFHPSPRFLEETFYGDNEPLDAVRKYFHAERSDFSESFLLPPTAVSLDEHYSPPSWNHSTPPPNPNPVSRPLDHWASTTAEATWRAENVKINERFWRGFVPPSKSQLSEYSNPNSGPWNGKDMNRFGNSEGMVIADKMGSQLPPRPRAPTKDPRRRPTKDKISTPLPLPQSDRSLNVLPSIRTDKHDTPLPGTHRFPEIVHNPSFFQYQNASNNPAKNSLLHAPAPDSNATPPTLAKAVWPIPFVQPFDKKMCYTGPPDDSRLAMLSSMLAPEVDLQLDKQTSSPNIRVATKLILKSNPAPRSHPPMLPFDNKMRYTGPPNDSRLATLSSILRPDVTPDTDFQLGAHAALRAATEFAVKFKPRPAASKTLNLSQSLSIGENPPIAMPLEFRGQKKPQDVPPLPVPAVTRLPPQNMVNIIPPPSSSPAHTLNHHSLAFRDMHQSVFTASVQTFPQPVRDSGKATLVQNLTEKSNATSPISKGLGHPPLTKQTPAALKSAFTNPSPLTPSHPSTGRWYFGTPGRAHASPTVDLPASPTSEERPSALGWAFNTSTPSARRLASNSSTFGPITSTLGSSPRILGPEQNFTSTSALWLERTRYPLAFDVGGTKGRAAKYEDPWNETMASVSPRAPKMEISGLPVTDPKEETNLHFEQPSIEFLREVASESESEEETSAETELDQLEYEPLYPPPALVSALPSTIAEAPEPLTSEPTVVPTLIPELVATAHPSIEAHDFIPLATPSKLRETNALPAAVSNYWLQYQSSEDEESETSCPEEPAEIVHIKTSIFTTPPPSIDKVPEESAEPLQLSPLPATTPPRIGTPDSLADQHDFVSLGGPSSLKEGARVSFQTESYWLGLENQSGPRKRKQDQLDSNIDKRTLLVDTSPMHWTRNIRLHGCKTAAEMLTEEVETFAKYISPTPGERKARIALVDRIREAINGSWGDCTVTLFGSVATDLYLPTGDIDLVVHSGSTTRKGETNLLRDISKRLLKRNIVTSAQLIDAAVPILKCSTTPGRISIDISINQRNGPHAARIVKGFVQGMPALRPIVLVVKQYLHIRSMNTVHTGGLSSYSIVCMVANFLQMHPKLRNGEIDQSKNVGVLLIEFFELYGNYFNYQTTGLCLCDGGSYFTKHTRGWKPEFLSIEDPCDIDNNIAKKTFNIRLIRNALGDAFDALGSAVRRREAFLKQQRNPEESVDIISASGESMLACIINITDGMMEDRQTRAVAFTPSGPKDRTGVFAPIPTLMTRESNDVPYSQVLASRQARRVARAERQQEIFNPSEQATDHSAEYSLRKPLGNDMSALASRVEGLATSPSSQRMHVRNTESLVLDHSNGDKDEGRVKRSRLQSRSSGRENEEPVAIGRRRGGRPAALYKNKSVRFA